jgi:hypothetical protein
MEDENFELDPDQSTSNAKLSRLRLAARHRTAKPAHGGLNYSASSSMFQ